MKLIFLSCLLASLVSANAQDTSWTIYRVRNSGLPDNNVADITFDRNGVAWVATWGGLARYDGTTWQVYDTTNSAIPINLINHVSFDALGKMWIGTNGAGVAGFDGRTWTHFDLPAPNIVLTVEVDKFGRKWIGTFTDGLYVYDTGKLSKLWGPSGSLESNVNDILFDKEGNTWFATPLGAFKVRAGTTEPERVPEFEGHVFDLDMDHNGKIWLATLPIGKLSSSNGKKWEDLEFTTTAESDRLESYHLQSVNVFKSGAILTGTPTRGELARYHEGRWDRIITPFADLMNEGISSVAIDDENNMWVGTWGQGLMVSDYFTQGEDSLVLETLIETGTFEEREIEEQFTVICRSRDVEIRLWDELKEDGDSVSLSLNGKWLAEDLALDRKGVSYMVELRPGDNLLILHAKNLGSIPPNTAAMQVKDGTSIEKLSLKSDLKKSGTIRLVWRPE